MRQTIRTKKVEDKKKSDVDGHRGNGKGVRGGHNRAGRSQWRGASYGTCAPPRSFRGTNGDDRETQSSQQNSAQFMKPYFLTI